MLLEAADVMSAVVVKNADLVAASSLKTMLELDALAIKDPATALIVTLLDAASKMLSPALVIAFAPTSNLDEAEVASRAKYMLLEPDRITELL